VREIMAKHSTLAPDIIWINSGYYFGPESVSLLRQLDCPVILYVNDDPTGSRDGRRFDSLLKALPVYDLCVICRQENILEFLDRGARRVYRVFMSYDEIIHSPIDDTSKIAEQYISDVAFIGTWMRGEDRDIFLLSLIEQGLNISIWGNRWQKSPYWKLLRSSWRGNALHGRDYVAAIQGSKIMLGLVSHGNRDLHTRRSVEIPYAGGLLCAERTTEHIAMYREGVEAVFWKDVEECAVVCKKLLADYELRERIRLQGMRRVRQGGYSNESVCRDILSQLFSEKPRYPEASERSNLVRQSANQM